MTLAAVLVGAYLLGSLPTSYIVVHRFTGRDIRSIGTGNPGTMNVLDSVGVWPAAIVGVGDVAKGMAAVGLAFLAGLGDTAAVLAALTAVIGHDYSIFLRLDGGHGSATVIGSSLMLTPLPAGLAGSAGLAMALLLRNRRIGGLLAMGLYPTLAFALGAPTLKVYAAVALVSLTLVQIVRDEGVSLSPVHTRTRR